VRRAAAAVVALLALVAGACDRAPDREAATENATTSTTNPTTAEPATATCTPARTGAPGTSNGTIPFGGLDRSYTLHLPPAYDGRTAVPLVFDFHGHGSNAGVQLAYSAIVPVADREGFAVVAPQGQGSPPHFTLLGATATEADDVELTVALLDRLAATLCLDERRVYALGMSNGGALSSVLACRAGDRFAAVGAVAAIVHLPQPCQDAERVAPISAFMGTADPVVPFAGGRVNCCGNPSIPATETTMAQFAEVAGCEAEPSSERPQPNVDHRRWTGCDPGAAVELHVIEGGGHTWPGSPFDVGGRGLGGSTPELPATELLWAFFERHRLDPA
jgi:polyhydroxybutyrate depolymerase